MVKVPLRCAFEDFGSHTGEKKDVSEICLGSQARIAQNIIHEALRMGKDVIVLGDFNDFDSDVPDPSGELPSSKVLRL